MVSAILSRFRSHPLWPEVREVLTTLQQNGFEAVLAGGCVRDALLGRPLADFDVATNARPEDVERLFEKTVAVGKAFGVIRVVGRIGAVEVATFRTEGHYQDGRHPQDVRFADLETDAGRRDFTINALYFSLPQGSVIDVVGGRLDLERKIIRTVGEAERRFAEDLLRPLRAIRFAAQLGFAIEPTTWRALVVSSGGLYRVAKERQAAELKKLSLGERSGLGWELLRRSRLLDQVLPELAQCLALRPRQWSQALIALVRESSSWPLPVALGWFAFRLGIHSETLRSWLEDLKLASQEVTQGCDIWKGLENLCEARTSLADRLLILNGEAGPWLIKLWPEALTNKSALWPRIATTVEQFQRLMKSDGHLPAPWLDGDDLLQLGLRPGPELGLLLKRAYHLQLEGKASSRQELLKMVQRNLKTTS